MYLAALGKLCKILFQLNPSGCAASERQELILILLTLMNGVTAFKNNKTLNLLKSAYGQVKL